MRASSKLEGNKMSTKATLVAGITPQKPWGAVSVLLGLMMQHGIDNKQAQVPTETWGVSLAKASSFLAYTKLYEPGIEIAVLNMGWE